MQFDPNRLFSSVNRMSNPEFPDHLGAHYHFEPEGQPFNQIVRQNSILTPTAQVEDVQQSTNSSSKKLSDCESKDETCSHQNFLKAEFSAKKRCRSDEDVTSCNEDLSVATKTASKQPIDSISEEDDDADMIYVPYDYQGDGRKREAKRHKSHSIVPRDEIDLDAMIREQQNTNSKIIALEQALEELKFSKLSKRELQSSRNRLTAQLSRDRQKLELNFLKTQCINYQRLLRRLNKKLKDCSYFCEKCNGKLTDTLQHHQTNLFVREEQLGFD